MLKTNVTLSGKDICGSATTEEGAFAFQASQPLVEATAACLRGIGAHHSSLTPFAGLQEYVRS